MAVSKKLKLSKPPFWVGEATPKGTFAKFGFFEAAVLYIFGHIPTNAYAILAAIFQPEFKHPKFKHPNGIHEVSFMHSRVSHWHDVLYGYATQKHQTYPSGLHA